MEKLTKVALITIIVSLAFIFLVVIATSGTETETQDGSTELGACFMAQQFMTDRLKAPSSAEFENCNDATITFLGNNTYEVLSYVDSQNGFGAMLRTNYYVELYYLGDEYWRMLDIITD